MSSPPRVREVVAAIERGALSLRHVDDLFHAVLHLLRTDFERDMRRYAPDLIDPDRDANKDVNERALQAFVLMWLDLKIRNAAVVREPVEGDGDRPDGVLLAPSLRGKMLELVIEAKWSHNGKLAAGLRDQLGHRYLIKENRRAGIYIVGFTGKPKRKVVDKNLTAARDAFVVNNAALLMEFVVVPWKKTDDAPGVVVVTARRKAAPKSKTKQKIRAARPQPKRLGAKRRRP